MSRWRASFWWLTWLRSERVAATYLLSCGTAWPERGPSVAFGRCIRPGAVPDGAVKVANVMRSGAAGAVTRRLPLGCWIHKCWSSLEDSWFRQAAHLPNG